MRASAIRNDENVRDNFWYDHFRSSLAVYICDICDPSSSERNPPRRRAAPFELHGQNVREITGYSIRGFTVIEFESLGLRALIVRVTLDYVAAANRFHAPSILELCSLQIIRCACESERRETNAESFGDEKIALFIRRRRNCARARALTPPVISSST